MKGKTDFSCSATFSSLPLGSGGQCSAATCITRSISPFPTHVPILPGRGLVANSLGRGSFAFSCFCGWIFSLAIMTRIVIVNRAPEPCRSASECKISFGPLDFHMRVARVTRVGPCFFSICSESREVTTSRTPGVALGRNCQSRAL